MTRKKPKELEELVELPESFKACWYWFLSLNATRQSGMGFSPITYSEMKAYFDLYSINVETWEIEVIKVFDGIAFEFSKKQQEQAEAEHKNKQRQKSK